MTGQFTRQFERATIELIRRPSARDKQRNIGPSDMADPCNRCIAFKMAGTPLPQAETLFAWNGTGKHKQMESDIEDIKLTDRADIDPSTIFAKEFWDEALVEVEVPICVIPGYGPVNGHLDILHPGGVGDWKQSDKKKIAGFRASLDKGVYPLTLQKHASQLTLYIGAARRLGYNIDTGVLGFIPRDIATIGDLWFHEVTYSEQNEQKLIERVTAIYQYVKAGRHHDIPSDPDCYVCHPRYYR